MLARIYGLTDPDTGAVRYVGRTIEVIEQRLREHISVSLRKSQCGRSRWIRELHQQGNRPGIVLIEEVDALEAMAAEAYWIAEYRASTPDLLNEQSAYVGGYQRFIIEWTPERVALLGVVPDEKLAEQLGIDRKTVEYHRKKRRIPRVPQQNFVVPPTGGWNKLALSDDIVARLGSVPDYVLAAEIGVDKSVIARRRKALGIASFAEQTGNTSRYKAGHRPARWNKQRVRDRQDSPGS